MVEGCQRHEPLLSAFLDDELGLGARRSVEAHLRGCAACRRDVAGLAEARRLLRNLPPRRLPEQVARTAAEVSADRLSGAGSATSGRPRRRLLATAGRVGVVTVLAVGALSGVAFGLGGPAAPDRVVQVPVDLFVADHLVLTAARSPGGPVLGDGP